MIQQAAFSPIVSVTSLINSLQYSIHILILFLSFLNYYSLLVSMLYFTMSVLCFLHVLKVSLSVIEIWQKVKSGILTLKCSLSWIVI